MNVKGSADVGNSSTKIIMVDEIVGVKARKQPTVVSYLPRVPQFEDQDTDTLVANLHKNIIVNVSSNGIKRGGLFAVGDIANTLGGSGLNIQQHKKAEHDYTLIQPLAMLAVNAVQSVYSQDKELPGSISLELEYATAIPVVDYSKAEARALEARWMDAPHNLIVYVGEGQQVQVSITVKGAKVVQEGIPAFYAIVEGASTLFGDYNKRYGIGYNGKDFAMRKMLFVDIGEGTLELIVIVDGKPVVIKSDGFRYGVGHAAEKALVSFKDANNFRAELTRSNFMKKVLDRSDKWHSEASEALRGAIYEQEQKIYDAIIATIENVLLSDLDDVVVFGGGTNTFIELKERLIQYTDQYKMRVLWIDGKEAALLNALGLHNLNEKVFFQK